MNVREIKVIREKLSLHTKGMTAEQLNIFYRERTDKAFKVIDEMRKQKVKSVHKDINSTLPK